MKKSLILSVLTLVMFSLVFFGFAPKATPAPAPKPIVLKLADHWPATHPLAIAWFKAFMDEVESRTKGSVKFEYYPSESLVKAKGSLEALQRGVIDMANIVSSYIAGRAPLLSCPDMPFMANDTPTQIRAIIAFNESDLIQEVFRKLNLRPIVPFVPGANHLITNKPIRVLKDFKGLKIRTTGGLMAKTIDALGATSVTFPSSDLYEALQRKTVDGGGYNTSGMVGMHLYEVAKYVTVCAVTITHATLQVNLDTWNRLPKDVQEIILQVGTEISLTSGAKIDKDDLQRQKLLEQKGLAVYFLPETERARWREAAKKPVKERWLDEMGQAGRKVFDVYEKALER